MSHASQINIDLADELNAITIVSDETNQVSRNIPTFEGGVKMQRHGQCYPFSRTKANEDRMPHVNEISAGSDAKALEQKPI